MSSFLSGLSGEYWQQNANAHRKLVPQKIDRELEKPRYTNRDKIEPILESYELVEERACILASDIGLPFEWAEAIVNLRNCVKPLLVRQVEWERIRRVSEELYKDNFLKLKLIIKQGWALGDIFGACQTRPMIRADKKGLLMLLKEKDSISEITPEYIKTQQSIHSSNVFYKKRTPINGVVLLYELDGVKPS
jgi:hypothetical protein